MLDSNNTTLLQISSVNLHTPELRFNLPDSVLLLMSLSIAKCHIHVLQSLQKNVSTPNTTPRIKTRHTFPLVSGTKKYVNPAASRQNAAKKIYVPHLMLASMSGVTRPMILEGVKREILKSTFRE
jgi:hypothetical protein